MKKTGGLIQSIRHLAVCIMAIFLILAWIIYKEKHENYKQLWEDVAKIKYKLNISE